MADKFSIDDIISEYSEKVENDLKTDESQENDEILNEDTNEDTNIDESIEKDNDTSDIDSDGYDPIKATDLMMNWRQIIRMRKNVTRKMLHL